MKIRIAMVDMPTTFINNPKCKGIEAEAMIRVRGPRSPAALLLVFDTPKSLGHFWVNQLCTDVSGALGAVTGLSRRVEDYRVPSKPKFFLEVDRNLACIIGLCRTHLSTEIVVHESVHAGFAFSQRFKAGIWDNTENEEEDVCYPAGRVAAAINDFLHKKGYHAAR